MNPFEFLKSINISKEDIMLDDVAEKNYNAFIINRSLSYFPDTVLLANEMNIHHGLDNKLQFHFLLNTVSKKKRFSKWAKPKQIESLEIVKAYYKVSDQKAKDMLKLLTESQLKELNQRMYTGGKR